MNVDLSSLPDSTRCALLIGSGDMTVGELRAALGGEQDPEEAWKKEVVRRAVHEGTKNIR